VVSVLWLYLKLDWMSPDFSQEVTYLFQIHSLIQSFQTA